jgi:type I restriction enzyme S subunit
MLKPGYKQMDLGELPEEQPLGNLFWDKISRTPIKDQNEEVSFVGMEDVSEKGELEASYQMPYKQMRRGLTSFEKGDVLVAKITPCFENGKGAYLGNLKTNKGFGSTEFHVLRAKPQADARYIFYHTQSSDFRLKLAGEMVGSAGHRRVPLPAIKNYVLPFSHSHVEQQAIADALGAVDALLREQRALLAKKRDLKKATQTALLTRARRLPGFSGEWQEKTLGEVATGFSSGATPFRGNKHYYNGNIKWVTSGELNYNIITDTIEHISPLAVKRTNLSVLPKGTFLMAITGLEAAGTRGSCAILGTEATTNQSCMAVFPGKELLTDYLFHYYVNYGDELAFRYCQGTKQQSYTGKIVKILPIYLPPIDEQRAIVNVLNNMAGEIAGLAAQVAKTEALKQGLMQNLLTGTIRLTGAATSPTV